ncbi:MAG: hypothetical protein WDO12_06795 [Pseudomonadota bacterium]
MTCLAALAATPLAQAATADPYASVFHDVEAEAYLRRTQIDAAAPEPGSFTALGVAPFQTAQTLSPFDLSFAAAQSLDGAHRPRTTLAIDFSSLTLLRSRPWHVSDYKGHHDHRVVARAQLSLAASRGEGDDDRSLRLAPALRVVLHQERDPRVHRGPGSLEDCFERNAPMSGDRRIAIAELGQQLDAVEAELDAPFPDEATRDATLADWQSLESRWDGAVNEYRRALQESIDKGEATCREDAQMAAYAWNSTGLVVGGSPTFIAHDGRIGNVAAHGYSAWTTVSYGFDARSTLRNWSPTFFGRHAQLLGQFLFRHDQLLQRPGRRDVMDEADQYAYSVRMRAGTSPVNGSLEFALMRDDFDNGAADSYTGVTLGADLRLRYGTWLSASIGRTFARERIPDQTSLRVSLQWSVF